MPCDGIYPFAPNGEEYGSCWMCNQTGDHFVWEWDTFICVSCIPAFLETEEGRIVLEHKHAINVCLVREGEQILPVMLEVLKAFGEASKKLGEK